MRKVRKEFLKNLRVLGGLRGEKVLPHPFQVWVIERLASHLGHIDPFAVNLDAHHIAREIGHCAAIIVEQPRTDRINIHGDSQLFELAHLFRIEPTRDHDLHVAAIVTRSVSPRLGQFPAF